MIMAGLVLACAVVDASEVGDRFPDFDLKDLKGHAVSWRQFQGKVVVVNLWMTTCPPCKKEMPMLQRLQDKYANRGAIFVGISTDALARTAAKFAKQLNITYTLLIDPALYTEEVEQRKFGFVGLPTTFIVDRDGVIRKKVIGFTYANEIEPALLEALKN
jgi:peroxiredoxin